MLNSFAVDNFLLLLNLIWCMKNVNFFIKCQVGLKSEEWIKFISK